jgi:putative aldouronate transport system substrate-binding protein
MPPPPLEEGFAEYDGVSNFFITEEPSTVTLFYPFGANGAPTPDMPVWQKSAELTNVTMENVANPSIADDAQSTSTMLASGTLPDIIWGAKLNLRPLISQGAFMPLNDLIEQYAPNIKRFLSEYPDALASGSGPDGQVYYIGGTLGGEAGQALPSMAYFIRQDWLDKLGLPIPTTFQQFKDTLYAFRNDDPNGNGEKDEIPYLNRQAGIWGILPLFGAHNNTTYLGDDGQIHHEAITETYKEALRELAVWYKDGIIDPELFTRGGQARQELFGNDTGGSTIDWVTSTGAINTNPDVLAQVPGINLVGFLPPADVNGRVWMYYTREALHAYAWGMSKDCADPVKVIRYMDFWFSEPGHLLQAFGIEGVDYTFVNGEPELTDEAKNKPESYPVYQRTIGIYEIGKEGSMESEISTMNDSSREAFELYLNSDCLVPPLPALTFTEEEDDALNRINEELTVYVDEYQQKIVLGAEDIDASWDQYVSGLKSIGVDELTRIWNDAYQRYVASLR